MQQDEGQGWPVIENNSRTKQVLSTWQSAPALLINRGEMIGQRGHDLVLPGEQQGAATGLGSATWRDVRRLSRKDPVTSYTETEIVGEVGSVGPGQLPLGQEGIRWKH